MKTCNDWANKNLGLGSVHCALRATLVAINTHRFSPRTFDDIK